MHNSDASRFPPTEGETATESAAGLRRTWVPIRSLGPRHRARILAHLLGLDARSRYLRFGYAATDAQIAAYVDKIDFEHDEAFGIFDRRLDLIAFAHLAYRTQDRHRNGETTAEFGVSVVDKARRRGFGRRLFDHSALHARNRGVRSLLIHALSDNTAMLRLARDAGAAVERHGPESQAWLALPPDTFASHLDELFGSRAAELDYQWKRRAWHAAGEPSVDDPDDARSGGG